MDGGQITFAVITAVFGGGGFIVGVLGLVFARRAHQLAENANEIAKAGNQAAMDAVGKADEANGIAEKANDLAGDSNKIARRALSITEDTVEYNWVLKIDEDGTARVVNDCAYPAHEVAVFVDVGGDHVASARVDEVAAFGEIPLDARGAFEEHAERVRRNPYRHSSSGGGMFIAGGPGRSVSTEFRAAVDWKTAHDVSRHCTVKEIVKHRMEHGGMARKKN